MRMGIWKSRYIESDKTYYYTRKFNTIFSLYKVLESLSVFPRVAATWAPLLQTQNLGVS